MRRSRPSSVKYSRNLNKLSYPNSPSLSYYQIKGRFLQTNSKAFHDENTTMLSLPRMDQMYQTLVQNAYRIPMQLQPNINLVFPVQVSNIRELFNSDGICTSAHLISLIQNLYSSQIPTLPKGKNWQAYVDTIFYSYNFANGASNDKIFTISVVFPDFEQNVPLIYKPSAFSASSQQTQANVEFNFRPLSSTLVTYNNVTYSANSVSTTNASLGGFHDIPFSTLPQLPYINENPALAPLSYLNLLSVSGVDQLPGTFLVPVNIYFS